jgi:hypothetical protein
MWRSLTFLFVWNLLLFLFPASVHAYYTNMPASVVVGQSDFTSGTANQGGAVTASTLSNPYGSAYDPESKKLIVSDRSNNRVLIYNRIPSSNNASADVVIGQANLSSNSVNQGGGTGAANTLNVPAHVYVKNGKLFIADLGNHRVLIYNSIPTTNNASADVVIGQANFTSVAANQGADTTSAAANTLRQPFNISSDGTKLFISDGGNNRVLIYNSIPTTNNASADVVVGQTNFTNRSSNQGGSAGANTLSATEGLTVVNNKLIISDTTNHRLLIYNSIPTTNNASADVVVGQESFTFVGVNPGGLSYTIRSPRDVFSDGKRLFVATNFSARTIIQNIIPSLNNTPHDLVVGSTDNASHTTDNGMNQPNGLIVAEEKLIVADSGSNRVLIFDNVLSGPQLNMNAPVESTNGKLKVSGDIQLGERGKYSLQKMQANVNGQGFGNVSYLSGGRDNGSSQTLYDFYHEFEPWAGNGTKESWTTEKGYTVNLKASSFNAEEDQIFYFQPFGIKSVTGSQINLTINKDHWNRIKDNLDSFEIQTKRGNSWVTLVEKISIEPESITTTKSLSGELRLVAIDKWGHKQETNSISTSLSNFSSYNTNYKTATAGFPLQINKITGVNAGIISTYMSMPKNSLMTSTTKPIFSGIAYAGSLVTVLVTDPVVGRSKAFTTVTKLDSSWSFPLTLYSSSVIDTWASDLSGRYTELPAFKLSVIRSQQ